MKSPQQGIITRPQGHLLILALDLAATDPAAGNTAVEGLRAVIDDELHSKLPQEDPTTPKDAPGPETGELGFHDDYYRSFLTITVGFSCRAFDKLGIVQDLRPQDLSEVPWDLMNDSPEVKEPGDLIVQICSDDVYINEHVARRIETELKGDFTIAWSIQGVQRFTSHAGRTSRERGRALIGFLDGVSNLDPAKNPQDADLVFVDPKKAASYPKVPPSGQTGYGQPTGPNFPSDLRPPPDHEPEWTAGGTYMVVRASTIDIPGWDVDALGDQEKTIGRFKYSGASLDLADDPSKTLDPPAFAADASNQAVPLIAHIRKANPRGPDDADRRIFRRGYPMFSAVLSIEQRGLIFVAFARSISTQAEFIIRGWMKNPDFPSPGSGQDALLRFEKVRVGGYYFVPPLGKAHEPSSWIWPPK